MTTTQPSLAAADIHFIMETILLEISIGEKIPVDDLRIVRTKTASFVVRKSTGRGIVRQLHAEI